MSLLAELRRRNVIRVAGLYVVSAWLLLQVAETLLPIFDTPGWVLKALVVMLGVGFVPALVFSWAFELTPEGLKRERDIDRSQSIVDQTARKLDIAVIALLLLIGALILWGPDRKVGSDSTFTSTPEANGISPRSKVDSDPTFTREISERSVAVLPFVNMSNDPDQEYFSDGISEELLNRLAKVPDLQVAARTSSFQFKGKNPDVGDIGRQLRVAHVLEGSVRKSGIRLRITAQLIDSRSGYHLWSDVYEREATDVFRVQDEIASEIAQQLQATLAAQGAPTEVAAQVDPAAFDDYLLARSYVAKRWKENLVLATEAFDRAIAKDPDFAAAHSGRAFAQLLMPMWGSGESTRYLREAKASAERALALAPENAEAWMVRGMVASFSYRASDAHSDLKRALALAPNSVDILNLYGDLLTFAGALGEAERVKRAAMLRDPLAMVHPMNLADIMLAQGRTREGLQFAEQAKALGASNFAIDRIVIAHTHLGQPDEASAAAEEGCAIDAPRDRSCSLNRALALVAQGKSDQATALLEESIERKLQGGLAEDDVALEVAPWGFVQTGDIALATRLQRRCVERSCWFVTTALIGTRHGIALPEEISSDPDWLAVWADPRITDVMQDFRRNVLAWRAEQQP
ncbi:MAG TPA: hypothetical protein VFY12_09555 [Arenimonas sp.]|nr:hypothetical protein [Arenimonas sp.]